MSYLLIHIYPIHWCYRWECVPLSDGFAFRLQHLFPVHKLFFARVISSHWKPAEYLFSSHLLDVDDGEHETHAWKIEFDNLEHECLVVLWIKHWSSYGSFAFWQLLSNRIEHRYFDVCIYTKEKVPSVFASSKIMQSLQHGVILENVTLKEKAHVLRSRMSPLIFHVSFKEIRGKRIDFRRF